jgi:hypothetical protein
MLQMSFQKLGLNHLITIIILIGGTVMLVFVITSTVNSVMTAYSVDETQMLIDGTSLNKQEIGKAVKLIGKGEIVKKPASKIEVKSSDPKKVEIVNGSGEEGAAAEVQKIFDSGITEVLLKNSEVGLDSVTIYYKNEYKDWNKRLESSLKEMGWLNMKFELRQDSEFDISILLGGNKTPK